MLRQNLLSIDNRYGPEGRGAVPSLVAANKAAGYEQLMGRWSRRLAAPFVAFAAIGDTGAILDVGCGTGSLTFTLKEAVPGATITGIDFSQTYIDYARSNAAGAGITFEQGDAAVLPYADRAFDAVLSLLVLNFVSDAEKAAWEMTRVTKPGGVVAASVWDFRGGLPYLRVFLDTAATLDAVGGEALRAKVLSMPFVGAGELAAMWTKMGLRAVEQTALTVRMEFQSFANYWGPWLGGQGTVG